MCGSMADIQSAAAEIKRGKNRKKKNKPQHENIMSALFHRATIITQKSIIIKNSINQQSNHTNSVG